MAKADMTLAGWLKRIEKHHPSEIELGLDRIRRVHQKLGSPQPAPRVITVAGTNGKGSTVAIIEHVLNDMGVANGCYTSPHIHTFNERIRINGSPVDDQMLVNAFEQIEAACEQCEVPTALTYFEYTTLAALLCMASKALEVAVLEVGLGGRLDAVNLIDADVAIVTSIDLDHTEWLGPDRESIAREKAGIFRAGKLAIYAASDMPDAIAVQAETVAARLIIQGHDYCIDRSEDEWSLSSDSVLIEHLPKPGIPGDIQINNAAAAMLALNDLGLLQDMGRDTLSRVIRSVSLPGRFEQLATDPDIFVDVAHNEASAWVLADTVQSRIDMNRQTDPDQPVAVHLLLATLADKHTASFVEALVDTVTHWYISAHQKESVGTRWQSAADLMLSLREPLRGRRVTVFENLPHALDMARRRAAPQDLIICCGSFHTVSEIDQLIR